MKDFTFEMCDEVDEKFVRGLMKDAVIRRLLYGVKFKKAPVINILDELKNRHSE